MANTAEALGEVRRHWGWYLILGIALIVIGLYCVWAEGITTVVSVLVLGAILFVAGIF
jgi:uncharacterized membrane protein HdeD (DUF308 family)